MSTPNFETQDIFPLFIFDDRQDSDEDEDSYPLDWMCDDIERDLEDLNSGLTFFRITLASGYFGGLQFLVRMQKYAALAGFDEDGGEEVDNEDTRYYLDMCRSEAIRKFRAEQRKVVRLMRELSDAWGFEEYVCGGVFSNGEAIYYKATPRGRMLAAAKA